MKADLEILWDASQLWGPLLFNALKAYSEDCGASFSVVSAEEIAANGVTAPVLIVPGGSARHKLKALGASGAENICRFVRDGGAYLGFCGGAGLALRDSLGLCPWRRSSITDRMQHLISGHIECNVFSSAAAPFGISRASLPVWWPGRFEEDSGQDVQVLARFDSMGSDLYLGDLPVSALTGEDFEDWRALYGIEMEPSLLDAHPAAVCGEYGRGRYLISYSHFETPCSEDANHFLSSSLSWLTGEAYPYLEIPDPFVGTDSETDDFFRFGMRIGLFYEREPWLFGWRSDIPGSQINALRLALKCLPENSDLGKEFYEMLDIFLSGARGWLLSKRLSVMNEIGDMLPADILSGQKLSLFGPPMSGGGLCGTLIGMLDRQYLGMHRA